MSQKPSLELGQVVYILSDKAQSIVPAIVVEELIVKKFDGNQISWKVSIGPKENNKVVDSTRINGEIYHSLEEIRDILMDRFTTFVNGLCSETEKRTTNWYGKQAKHDSDNDFGKIDPENIVSSIEQRMNSNLENPMKSLPQNRPQRVSSKEEAREKLRNMLQDDEDVDDGVADPAKQVVKMTGPDGKEMLVSVKMPE